MDLKDRSILLTGAGTGIGRSLALQLADQGARLTLVAADVTAPGAAATVVAAAQERFGGIDVLVNNAGNVRAGRLEAIEEHEILAQVALNLTAPILLTRAVAGHSSL